MTKPLTIWVEPEQFSAALDALPGIDLVAFGPDMGYPAEPDLIMSHRARFFDPEWWSDPKLVEAALKRARVEKRKKVKK